MDSIQFVQMNPSLKAHVAENAIIDMVVAKVRAIPQHDKLRLSMDLVLLLANLIETACYDCGLTKANRPANFKLNIGLQVLQKLDWTQAQDREFFQNAISFLHSSGQIKKVPWYLRLWGKIKHFLVNTKM
jgi:hypothetical protein